MQDQSSIQDAAAARLNALRAEMLRFAVREEAYQRRVWHDASARDVRQLASELQDALALLTYRMATRKRWHAWLRKQARRRFAEIILRDGSACRYCGTTTRPLDLDHIQPLSRGGSNDLDNLALACRTCNLSKGTKTLDEWLGPAGVPAAPDLD